MKLLKIRKIKFFVAPCVMVCFCFLIMMLENNLISHRLNNGRSSIYSRKWFLLMSHYVLQFVF
jgi:plasmid replication initiation protein